MSGVNPTAVGASTSAVEAAIALELQALAADAQALRALLMEGDVVQATVQPFNGLTDTLDIMGLRVAAALPPDVLPGDTLTVAVQGFASDQVLVQVLSRASPSVSASTAASSSPSSPPPNPAATPAATTARGDSLELTQTPIPIVVGDLAPEQPLSPLPRPAAVVATPVTEEPPPKEQSSGAGGSRPAPPPAPQAAIRPENLDVEARVALARTAALRGGSIPSVTAGAPARVQSSPAQLPQSLAPPPTPQQALAITTAAAARIRPPQTAAGVRAMPPAEELPAPPTPPPVTITARSTAPRPPPAPLPGAPSVMRIARMIPPSPARVAVPTAAELLHDPPALLRALRIPVTPTTLTFAKLVTTQPEQVSTALRALETSLPNSTDSRIVALRTLAAFVGTLDPQSPTFTTQVTSYLTHVVEGTEQKLIALVLPQELAAQEPAAQEPAAQEPAGQSPPAQGQSPAPQPAAESTARILPTVRDEDTSAARTVERIAAADADLKTQLVAMLSSQQSENSLGEAGVAVARNALTALVATQLTALAAQQAQPGTWALTVPITIEQQIYPAQIHISRDKEERRGELSEDDFHIVFILDTKRLGTVAVDLHAARRAVSVSVRTERASAASTFQAALKQLGSRLEQMRYSVKSLDAAISRTKDEDAPVPPSDSLSTMDSKA